MKRPLTIVVLLFLFLFAIIAGRFFVVNSSVKYAPINTQNNAAGVPDKNDPLYGVYDQVCKDAVNEFLIAARQGDKMQMYAQAGFCCAAFLQVQDEANYRKWKAIEREIGRQIGMPQY